MASDLVFWVDRCLGTEVVPRALREIGANIRIYTDLYPHDPMVSDETWIPEVASRDWVILTKDKNIRRAAAEIQALRNARARYVCLSSSNMRGDEQAACLVGHWRMIESVVSAKPVPLIVSVTRDKVQWLDETHWRMAKRKR